MALKLTGFVSIFNNASTKNEGTYYKSFRFKPLNAPREERGWLANYAPGLTVAMLAKNEDGTPKLFTKTTDDGKTIAWYQTMAPVVVEFDVYDAERRLADIKSVTRADQLDELEFPV